MPSGYCAAQQETIITTILCFFCMLMSSQLFLHFHFLIPKFTRKLFLLPNVTQQLGQPIVLLYFGLITKKIFTAVNVWLIVLLYLGLMINNSSHQLLAPRVLLAFPTQSQSHPIPLIAFGETSVPDGIILWPMVLVY